MSAADFSEFYVVSVKHTHRQHKYITFWRPDDKGYAWPLSWAGRYSKASVLANPCYYNGGGDIAVPCVLIDALAVPPRPGEIDGDAGPVVLNNATNWRVLTGNTITPPSSKPRPQYKGARRLKGASYG